MDLPPEKYIRKEKVTLIAAIEAMIEVMRMKWINTALRQPRVVPIRRPAPIHTIPGIWACVASMAATYWETDAVAAKEMSIPPDTRTTNRPSARMAWTE